MIARALFGSVVLFAAACGPSSAANAKYPPRPDGCDVAVYEQAPRAPTDSIGAVSARCDEITSDAECLRELQDQACKLGADLVWGVSPKPRMESGKKVLAGRAAHTRTAAP